MFSQTKQSFNFACSLPIIFSPEETEGNHCFVYLFIAACPLSARSKSQRHTKAIKRYLLRSCSGQGKHHYTPAHLLQVDRSPIWPE